MLRRLALRDFVIVREVEVDLSGGFSALTGETGAGKSILIDALQLALGHRGDAGVVREGAARAEITAEFDAPASLAAWLDAAGFDATADTAGTLLLRRVIDAQGKSRAWVNGSAATIAQLREAAEHLVDIHGQHAWQSLTRASAVRALIDSRAGVDAPALAAAWSAWKAATDALDAARERQADAQRERERLAWQLGEIDKLAPAVDEWPLLNAEHQRLSNAQGLMDAAQAALQALAEDETNASDLTLKATQALADVAPHDARIGPILETLHSAQVQLDDAAHALSAYLGHADLDPARLQELDERLSAWMSLARRYRRAPAELPALRNEWTEDLRRLDAATDLDALAQAVTAARSSFDKVARAATTARTAAAASLAEAVTRAIQTLGMQGGRFEVALLPQAQPQSYGMESAEFLVAGHAGSTPRPLARVASGGELSRLALAIAVTTAAADVDASGAEPAAGTLIFDEIDAGVGGAVAETVGRLMKRLGRERQVLAVTHLPQVAACADHHWQVSKIATAAQGASTDVHLLGGEARVAEIARMLGGDRLSNTSLAHAQEMLALGAQSLPPAAPASTAPTAPPAKRRARS